MSFRFTPLVLPAILVLSLWTVPASADIIMEGYHGVGIKVCYGFISRPAHQPVAVVHGVSGFHAYVPLTNGQCVDQGYKFNTVSLFWADSIELAKGIPDSSTDPTKLSWLDSIHCLSDGGSISTNMTQYPDSVPIHEEKWTYSIVGNEIAVTWIEQYRREGTAMVLSSTRSINVPWGASSTTISRRMASGFSLGSVRGSKVRLTIPEGRAILRVMTLSGRVLRQMTILPTGTRAGVVDLGMTPPAGSFVELRQGTRSSVIAVARP